MRSAWCLLLAACGGSAGGTAPDGSIAGDAPGAHDGAADAPAYTLDSYAATGPRAAHLADLDGDGHADLVVLTAAGVDWRKGDGAGAFGDAQNLVTFPGEQFLAIGDTDGDGALDLALANASAALVFRNVGGSFARLSGTVAPTGDVTGLALTDLDGDGHPDVVVSSATDLRAVRVSGGGLAEVLHTGADAASLAVGDANGDGVADLLITTATDPASAEVLPTGHGANLLYTGTDMAGAVDHGAMLTAVAAGDIDGDGIPEVVMAQASPPGISTYSYVRDYRDSGHAAEQPVTAVAVTPTGLVSLEGAQLDVWTATDGAPQLATRVALPGPPLALAYDGAAVVTLADRIVVVR